MKSAVRSISILVLSIWSPLGAEELRVGALIGDSMVLQQNAENWIGGTGEPGTTVRVNLTPYARVWEDVVDDEGNWSVELPVGLANESPRRLTIETTDERIEINDVLVGELWLCSGQSNMVWTVDGSELADDFKAEANLPTLRMFAVGNVSEDTEQSDVPGRWIVCSPETVGRFSAVAFHFGRELAEVLDVPIGLVNSSWGGSRIEAWMRPDALAASGPCGQGWVDRWEEAKSALYANPSRYAAPDVDDSEWLAGTVPGYVNAFGIEDQVDGLFWHRISLQIPTEWSERALVVSLGKIDDHDVTYFNGEEIGRTNGWQAERRYEIPAPLVSEGDAVIAIRCLDGAGPGGIHGEPEALFIHPKGAPEDRQSLAGPARMIVASHARDMPAQHRPSYLYNGMLHPLRDIAFVGVIWYQGENNSIEEGDPDCYEGLLSGMIADWRDLFDSEEMSFQIVQLANFEHAPSWDYARIREAQRSVAQSDPNAGLAVTTDIGAARDIHPRNKHDVGNRLARWALVDVYDKEGVIKSGPLPVAARLNFAGGVTVYFETYGSQITEREGGRIVGGFEIAGEDQVFQPTTARIRGIDVLEVAAVAGISPAWVRYAWKGDPKEASLFNKEGLPASPFEMRVDAPREVAFGAVCGGMANQEGKLERDVLLVFSKTASFRHGSIPVGIKRFKKIGEELGLKVIATEDSSKINDEMLKKCAVVVFLNTTGDILDPSQEAALERYVKNGGGWIGVHAAADTEHDWPFYGELVGAYFKTHPRIQEAVVRVEDKEHPSTRMLPGLWRRTDEWYVYQLSPRPNVRVLASLDESTYSGGGMNGDHPIAWCHDLEEGRSFYTGGGHTDASYSEPKFIEHLRGAVIWAAELDPKPK